jgi:phosphate transport system permease protein
VTTTAPELSGPADRLLEDEPLASSNGVLRLPALLGLAAAVIALTVGLFAVTDLQGRAGFVVVAALLYLVAQTAVSAVVEGPRRSRDRAVTTAVATCFLVALIPLVSVAVYVVRQGATRFDAAFFTETLRGVGVRNPGGGARQAIIGTLQQVGLATLFSVPLGLLVSIYIVEYGRGRLAAAIRFFVDVMTGIPSIVAGLFVFSFWILGLGFGYSGFAAALALTILMLPTVVRSSEEMLKLVPDSLREASFALGVPKWKTILRIVMPTALPGILTGIMLAIARAMGETAPVLLTALGNPNLNTNPFSGAQSSLPLFIYQSAGNSLQAFIDRAWTAALVLILVVMALNLLARVIIKTSKIGKG